jgi:hypothetical protein
MPMTGTAHNSVNGGEFADRLLPVAKRLRESLLPLVEAVTGGVMRPGRLMQRLELDKSLASRIVQALREEELLEFLHRLPAPTGLRILVTASRERRAPSKLCSATEAAIEVFQELIDTTPGGRGSIDGWISSHSASARERNEHRSKQAIYRAMSYLLGCHCETMATTLVLQPADDGVHVDCFEIHQRNGLRRLRPSAPIALFSIFLHRGAENGTPQPWIETLDGETELEDPTRYLLDEYSSDPLPGIEVVTRGKHNIFTLNEEQVSIDAPVNLSSAYLVRHGFQLESFDEVDHESRSYLLNYPCKTLVRDVFIHEDLWPGTNPELSLRLPNPSGTDPLRLDGLLGRINTLDLHTPIEQLGRGLDRAAVKVLPRHKQLLTESFERTGWDPNRFRGYRTEVRYPVPMITMTWWFPLPGKNAR